MAKIAAFALLLHTAFAAVAEEELAPLRDVSPEEFHNLNLRQELEGKPKKVEKKTPVQIREEKKLEELREHRQAKMKLQREEELQAFQTIQEKQVAEEAEIKQAETTKILEEQAKAKEDAKKFHFPWEPKMHAPKAATFSTIKEGKSLACTDGNKEVLTFYVSQMSGGVSSRQILNRERCMRAQLDQHCMPYESFPATVIEPCDAGNWECANKRVLQDHANCLTKSVDWDAVQSYAKETGKTTWEVLGSWCSKVKLLKEITNRMQLDEKFASEYPALLMLEDHAILDREWAEEVTKDWVQNYDGQWDLVQLDTYGGSGLNRDKVGEFRKKAIFKPSWKGKYDGFHAVMINTKSVPTLLERMQSLNVVPVEWLPKSLNASPQGLEVLSWDAGVSTVAWEGSRTLKEKWMPNVPACESARTRKTQY